MQPAEKRFRRQELRYRRQEVHYMKRGFWLNSIALCLGLLTALAAVFAALQASRAVSAAQESAERQAREQRLANSVDALGGKTAAQQIAGVSMMTHSVMQEMDRVAQGDAGLSATDLANQRADAKSAYLAVVDALENYVGGWRTTRPSPSPTRATGVRTVRIRYVDPRTAVDPRAVADYAVPRDVTYAVDDLNLLLGRQMRHDAQQLDVNPGVDLADASLWGMSLSGFDASWLGGHYFPRIDLRGANLAGSRWGLSDLSDSHLQCAVLKDASFVDPQDPTHTGTNLRGADLRGASLRFADLRGADLEGADLRGAHLQGADLRGADVAGADFTGAPMPDVRLQGARGIDQAVGVDSSPAPATPDQGHCLAAYWAPAHG